MGTLRRSICKISGRAYVDDDLVCEADLMAAIVDRDQAERKKK
jgi:3-hydroxymyristoyl/3-hydroxydecanoyl-(acyl carrier protein) dehydratase